MVNPLAATLFGKYNLSPTSLFDVVYFGIPTQFHNLTLNQSTSLSGGGGFNFGYKVGVGQRIVAPVITTQRFDTSDSNEAINLWLQAAEQSAYEMMLERQMLEKNKGNDPLTAQQIDKNYTYDTFYSFLQFILDDYNIYWGTPQNVRDVLNDTVKYPNATVLSLVKPYITGEIVHPYNPEQVGVAALERNVRVAQKQAAIAKQITNVIASGHASGNLELDIAAATVKQQLTKALPLDYTQPIIGNKNVNVLGTTGVQRALDLALYQAQGITMTEDRKVSAKEGQVAKLLDYWKVNAPMIELRAVDNKNIPAQLLTYDWSFATSNVPLVNVRITPKEKPKPQLSLMGGIWGSVLGIVVSFIPVIGNIASAGISVAQKQSQNTYRNAWNIPTSAFQPQYAPKPFFVVMHIDEAQAAIKQPWFIPMLSYKIRDQSGGLYNPFN